MSFDSGLRPGSGRGTFAATAALILNRQRQQASRRIWRARHAEAVRHAREPSPPGRGQGEGSSPHSSAVPARAAIALTLTLSRGERGLSAQHYHR